MANLHIGKFHFIGRWHSRMTVNVYLCVNTLDNTFVIYQTATMYFSLSFRFFIHQIVDALLGSPLHHNITFCARFSRHFSRNHEYWWPITSFQFLDAIYIAVSICDVFLTSVYRYLSFSTTRSRKPSSISMTKDSWISEREGRSNIQKSSPV